MKTKIPEGYRKLRDGIKIKEGDMFNTYEGVERGYPWELSNNWSIAVVTPYPEMSKVGHSPNLIYIRPITTKSKPRKSK